MKTWLITGCSTGFGKVLAVAARGGRLVATARDPGALAELASHLFDTVRAAKLDQRSPAAGRRTLGPHGLASASGFFLGGDGGGLIAIAPTVFRD